MTDCEWPIRETRQLTWPVLRQYSAVRIEVFKSTTKHSKKVAATSVRDLGFVQQEAYHQLPCALRGLGKRGCYLQAFIHIQRVIRSYTSQLIVIFISNDFGT
jgi:hypothetical protein